MRRWYQAYMYISAQGGHTHFWLYELESFRVTWLLVAHGKSSWTRYRTCRHCTFHMKKIHSRIFYDDSLWLLYVFAFEYTMISISLLTQVSINLMFSRHIKTRTHSNVSLFIPFQRGPVHNIVGIIIVSVTDHHYLAQAIQHILNMQCLIKEKNRL